jgi:hypothetical protein
LGFVKATLFEFLAAAAGATVVPADFGGGTAVRLGLNLYYYSGNSLRAATIHAAVSFWS